MQAPLVSVICLCYNHEKFVVEALRSVFLQTYSNIELIIVDDASVDGSVKIIEEVLDDIDVSSTAKETQNKVFKLPKPPVFIKIQQNQGNCKAFNAGLKIAQGKYIIDLAADDVLLDDRIEKQVLLFESLPKEYAVVFSNAVNINEAGDILNYHYPVDKAGKSKVAVPQGNVYTEVLSRYFINTATMMMRTDTLQQMGGYNEDLSYEDFDFWVSTSRHYLYKYQDEVTTMKRVVRNSLSSAFYRNKMNPHLESTLQVFYKAFELNTSPSENLALSRQVSYHLRLAFYTQHFDLVFSFNDLLKKLNSTTKLTETIVLLSKNKINVYWFYHIYHKVKRWFASRLR
ncbi:glycosyltransferase [Microscilla marina]|uniref:Glycosyl transferase n=1 Tax=Microscilla marina ATCC 23134 TaxID=313606 RepID=A1ZXS4_MICM2|nr:glycosyltransferase [Microscilla marina]EAY24852.1 glycosyl transferase [Microscilla marina ATCC 23134]